MPARYAAGGRGTLQSNQDCQDCHIANTPLLATLPGTCAKVDGPRYAALREVDICAHSPLATCRVAPERTSRADGPRQVKDIDFRDAARVKERFALFLEGKFDTPPAKP